MSLTNPNTPVSQQDLQDFYHKLLPYMGNSFAMIANKFSKVDLYSTDEKMIGQWTDGKPLYQRTVDIGSVSAGANVTYSLSGLNIDVIVKLGGNGYASYGQWVEIGFPHQMIERYGVNALYNESNQSIIVHSGTDCSLTKCFITVQYTKTTDTAISIGDDTDYSTEEKIVGTWIDGSPIWQKTIDLGMLQSTSGTVDHNHNIGNIDQVVAFYSFGIGTSGTTINLNEVSASSTSPDKFRRTFVSKTAVRVSTNQDSSTIHGYCTIQYTKTT